MHRALILATALLTIGCTSQPEFDALSTDMQRDMAAAPDRATTHATLCAFAGLDPSCVSEDGPVPPPSAQ